MQDGSKVERRYALPLSEADGGADSTPAEQILAWESEPENLEREILVSEIQSAVYLWIYGPVYFYGA